MTMRTVFVYIAKDGKLQGISDSMEALPTTYTPVEVYAVRCSETAIEDARELLSREHTAPKALKMLRLVAHSFTFVGNT